jgi:hypothetical protein
MFGVPVVNIRQAFKARCQPFSHFAFALEARTPRLVPPRHSKTQSSAKNPIIESRSCALKASHNAVNFDRMSILPSDSHGHEQPEEAAQLQQAFTTGEMGFCDQAASQLL